MQTHSISVLLVDDDPDFRVILGEVLREAGCTVHEADNGKSALEVLDTVLPDLILMDLQMPVMDGWALHAAIQKDQRLAGIPLAVLSAVSRFRPGGTIRVVKKPVDVPSLLGLIDTVEQARAAG